MSLPPASDSGSSSLKNGPASNHLEVQITLLLDTRGDRCQPRITAPNHPAIMTTPIRDTAQIHATLLAAYLLLWIFFTASDLLTTLHALKIGFREMNPHTDFSSWQALVFPEFLIGIVGTTIFSAGLFLSREKLKTPPGGFDEFQRQFFPSRLNASALLIAPLAATMLRGLVVINNLVLISSGFAFIETARIFLAAAGIPISLTSVFFNSVAIFLMFKPAVFVTYVIIKKVGQ